MSRTKIEAPAAASKHREAFAKIVTQLKGQFVERDDAIDCVALAMLTGSNFILIGDAGTAKTAVVRAFYQHFPDARIFSTLCGSFATEDKMFGPLDINLFKEGKYQRVLDGRLGGTDLAFLDEMFKANDGCLNGMLTALNERDYEGRKIPLVCCGAASNWPEIRSRSANVNALWDRMLLRCPVKKIGAQLGNSGASKLEDLRVKMLASADSLKSYKPEVTLTLEELAACREEVAAIEINEAARRTLVSLVAKLEKQKVEVSDRRLGLMLMVLRASAWLEGKPSVDLDHFEGLRFGFWDREDQYDVVKTMLDSIDEDVVQEAVRELQAAYKQASGCKDPQQAPHMLRHAADISEKVKDLLRRKGVRRSSFLRAIKPETERVMAEYERLKRQIAGRVSKPSDDAPQF